ncbi:unnamed protein product [Dovyalis caffra]|uniref:Nitrate regulatory gene2 protein n=1 Tax=Dovyalis caffra TaxID=77055 RepID=A0AAV1SN41_9ROSI|nr:unnamed protein product [Dovyalis caffra]
MSNRGRLLAGSHNRNKFLLINTDENGRCVFGDMGIGMSKMDSLKLVSLCKERKELIKAAVDCRYELVSAHIMYLQSLVEMGNALYRFLEEDLEIIPDFSSDCSDEDSHLKFSSSDSDSLADSFHDHLHFSGDSSGSSGSEKDFQAGANSSRHVGNMSSSVPAGSRHRSPNCDNKDVYVPIIDVRYPQENNIVPLDAAMDNSENNATCAPNGYWESSRAPMGIPFNYEFWFPPTHTDPSEEESAPAAAPSPATVGSAWKFNPFNPEVDDAYHYYNCYSQENTTGDRAESDDSEVRKIREKEGIPDLEDHTDQSLVRKRRSKKKKSERDTSGDSGGGTKNDDHIQSEQEKGSKKTPDTVEEHTMACSSSHGLIDMEQENAMKEGEGSEEGRSFICDCECSETDIHYPRDLQQAVKEIKNEFETAFNYGQEVSILLEAGKLPFQTTGAKVKVFASQLVSLAAPSLAMSSKHPAYIQSSRSASKKMKSAKVVCENYRGVNRKINHLSSTLEELYVWEKKLYEEVKSVNSSLSTNLCTMHELEDLFISVHGVGWGGLPWKIHQERVYIGHSPSMKLPDEDFGIVEEKLRVIYDNEWKRLKRLDDIGAEASQIDRTQASVKSLLSKIKVPVGAIEAISIRIHKIRDEELQTQVNELIIGLARMWKLIIKCHKKQFQAIKNAETCVHIARMHTRKGSRLKATKNLEKETLKWAARFSHYIRTQKAFVSFLNNWLLRYISEELKTLDEVDPLSPTRIGAPAIFVVCNDWNNAIQSISEDGVYQAILGFASSLHHLQEKREEECRQRIKIEHLLKDLEDQFEQDVIVAMQEMLDEQKSTHQEAIKLANDAASECLTKGLPPVFETLKSFCLENLKAYEKIRIPNASTIR